MSIKAVLFDLSGVLYTDDTALPGALEALQRINNEGLHIRYVTNTTRSTRTSIISKLTKMGFHIDTEELFTAPSAIHDYLIQKKLSPYLIIHPDLEEEFADLVAANQHPDAVVMGDAGKYFTYEKLNPAFRYLIEGAPLLVMGINRYFKEADGLSLDIGPFVKGLEYAAEIKAIVFGKPAATFFHAAVKSTGYPPEETVMIGDDVQSDVIGALDAGLQGILVRTGKYRAGDEKQLINQYAINGHCVDDVSAAVDWIIDHK